MPLDEMLVFARVVEHQSFAGAARQLGLTTSAVSRSVGRLDFELVEDAGRGDRSFTTEWR